MPSVHLLYYLSSVYAQKTGGKKEGVAVFWKPTKLQLVHQQQLELDNPVGDESGKPLHTQQQQQQSLGKTEM